MRSHPIRVLLIVGVAVSAIIAVVAVSQLAQQNTSPDSANASYFPGFKLTNLSGQATIQGGTSITPVTGLNVTVSIQLPTQQYPSAGNPVASGGETTPAPGVGQPVASGGSDSNGVPSPSTNTNPPVNTRTSTLTANSAEVVITFDPTVLSITDVAIPASMLATNKTTDNVGGRITFDVVQSGGADFRDGQSIASLLFTIKNKSATSTIIKVDPSSKLGSPNVISGNYESMTVTAQFGNAPIQCQASPAVDPNFCKTGTVVPVKDTNGCTTNYKCVPAGCSVVTQPTCPQGQVLTGGGKDANGCETAATCTPTTTGPNCPRVEPIQCPPNTKLTPTSADARGCSTGYTCEQIPGTGVVTCPTFKVPTCPTGQTITQGALTANGCRGPLTCIPSQCGVPTNPTCKSGEKLVAGKVVDGCPTAGTCVGVPTCTPVATPANFCVGGTVVQSGFDANGCQLPPRCFPPSGNGTATCTQDVKKCSDGSYVSRDPANNCQFKTCPAVVIGDGSAGNGTTSSSSSGSTGTGTSKCSPLPSCYYTVGAGHCSVPANGFVRWCDPVPPTTPVASSCKADYNGTGTVDLTDFATFALNYKKEGVDCKYDVVSSGGSCYLDINDLIALSKVYNQTNACKIK